jgi:23S rRNA (cytidine1920-2'-O)/16S rRNA (cytidine1409-2'-O)-methyltransferase
MSFITRTFFLISGVLTGIWAGIFKADSLIRKNLLFQGYCAIIKQDASMRGMNFMKQKKKKVYLKERLIGEGWFETEKEAASWAMMRRIIVNDHAVSAISEKVDEDAVIRIKEYYKHRYVNKGGLKLEKFLKEFHLNLTDKITLDCGASKGGFTDCLLQHGAKYVYAVDAGHGQLAGKLLIDKRVKNLENTNISDETLLYINPTPHLITLDLSYLSLKKAVPVALEIIKNEGTIICLIKPIVEVNNSEIRRTGNINNPEIHFGILIDLLEFFKCLGLIAFGLTNSPIKGNNDAIEYLVGLTTQPDQEIIFNAEKDIKHSIDNGFSLEKFNKNDFSDKWHKNIGEGGLL